MGIQIETKDGKVPEYCMKLLLDFAGHKDLCDECLKAFKTKTTKYCITGSMIIKELCEQPEVSKHE